MKRFLFTFALVLAMPLLAQAQDRDVIIFTAQDGPEPIVAAIEVFHTELGTFFSARAFVVGRQFQGTADAGPGFVENTFVVGGLNVPWQLVFDLTTGEYIIWGPDTEWEGQGKIVFTP